MKVKMLILPLFFFLACGVTQQEVKQKQVKPIKQKEVKKEKMYQYPETKIKTVTDTYGPWCKEKKDCTNHKPIIVQDDYRWLEDVKSPETISWMKAQSDFFNNYIKDTQKEKIKTRYRKLFNYEKYSTPFKKGGYYFYSKNDGLQAHSVFYRVKKIGDTPEVVLDSNKMSKDGTVSVAGKYFNHDATLMAYGVSVGGTDNQTYYVKDLKNNKLLDDKLTNIRYSNIAWKKDSSGFYYSKYPDPKTVKKEDKNYYNKVYYHALGTTEDKDILIYEDKENKTNAFAPIVTDDGKYLLIYVWQGTDPNNRLLIREENTKNQFKDLFTKKASYDLIGNINDKFYILTNLDAPNKKVVTFDIDKNFFSNENIKLTTIIEETKNNIVSILFTNKNIVVNYLEDVHATLKRFDLNGKYLSDIKLPAPGSVSLSGDLNESQLFLSFTSFTYPNVVFEYNFTADKLETVFKSNLDFDPTKFESKQIFYTSKDGTKVSMFIVYKKGIKLDGTNPTLLYGYGGFNITLDPWFSTIRVLWMENGGVFAVANLRGGGEYGEKWHKAGMKENKQNVFDDFYAAAHYLIDNKYTNSKKLAIMGGSNGGLLVATAMTQEPNLFGAVVCQVPLTDMLRFHKFLVGHYWIPEYGNAENSKKEFDYLHKYSPYHNVKNINYPSTLIITGDSDDRVAPLHARKFAAIVQKNNKSDNPILLKVNWKSGHGHGQSTEQIINGQADIYGFLFKIFNIKMK